MSEDFLTSPETIPDPKPGESIITLDGLHEFNRLTGRPVTTDRAEPEVSTAQLMGEISCLVWKKFGDGVVVRAIKEIEVSRTPLLGIPFAVNSTDPEPVANSRLGEVEITFEVKQSVNQQDTIIGHGKLVVIPPTSSAPVMRSTETPVPSSVQDSQAVNLAEPSKQEDGILYHARVTGDEVGQFAQLSGDQNPIHSGDGAIIHGALLLSKISAFIEQTYPGFEVCGIDQLTISRSIKPGEVFTVLVGEKPEIEGQPKMPLKIIVKKSDGGREREVASGNVLVTSQTH